MLPGCQPPERLQGSVLNSYTYNIALETNSGTCRSHRQMRQVERRAIHDRRQTLPHRGRNMKILHRVSARVRVKSAQKPVDIYHFPTDASSSDVGGWLLG